MTLDDAGHRTINNLKRILEKYDDYIKLAAGSNDGKWKSCFELKEGKTIEDINKGMREFHQLRLDDDLDQEDHIIGFLDGETCFGCGKCLKYVLTGNKLQLRNYYDFDSNKFVNYSADYMCPFNKPPKFEGHITISDKLYFVNFINEIADTPEGKKYSSEYDLNTIAGRYEIAKYKLEHNVAYSQVVGGVGIYINKDKTSIIVGDSCHPAEFKSFESDEDFYEAIAKPVYPGYEKVGELSLDVWRFEATDLTTIKKNDALLRKDHCELNVPHGKWLFENFSEINRASEKDEYNFVSKFTFLG